MRIAQIYARQILDSRGMPTVEVDITLDSGAMGRAQVPSGASTGRSEAVELRDRDPAHFRGKGVLTAVQHVNSVIAGALIGADVTDQEGIDRLLLDLDGTPQKSRLGANALLGVSLAAARAAAVGTGLPLFRYLGGESATTLPVPMINIISGGLHAGSQLDLQDFLVIPWGAGCYADALRWVTDVYAATRTVLWERGYSTLGADEGGFGPALGSNEEALEILMLAVERAGYRPGDDIALAIDVASTHFLQPDSTYHLRSEDRKLSTGEMIELLERWVDRYPVISIEDGLAEDDWKGWQELTLRLGQRVALVGDDLFTTNLHRLQRGIAEHVANAVLVKPNQIGTLTETLQVVKAAKAAGYLSVISARSGETEDAFVSDLAVATTVGQLKVGSVTRSERLAKWNQLLRIEEELGDRAVWPGKQVWARFVRP